MISHSDAIGVWDSIWNGPAPFPFKETMRKMKKSDRYVLNQVLTLYLYFRDLRNKQTPPNKIEFEAVSHVFFNLAAYLPRDTSDNLLDDEDMRYTKLRDYFSQMKNYTPINRLTGRRFFT